MLNEIKSPLTLKTSQDTLPLNEQQENTDMEKENIDKNPGSPKEAEVHPEKFNGPGQKPKTANKAFGSTSDFVLFFENRNPEMKEFAEEFEEIEKMKPKFSIGLLNTVIAPEIDECLQQAYQKRKATTKSKFEKRENRYAGLFKVSFKTWEEFYKQILRAYTISGFLYKNMNEYLRNENWMELDALLPYVYCLFKAFLWGPTGLTRQESFEALKARSKENKLILYRGADFDDESLKFYDPRKIKNFSWNGVISTSLIESVTKKFQGDSLKRPILIIIDIDFEDLQPGDLNALYLAAFSEYPKEQEVALPPGSIFELLEINQEESEVVMRLRLVTNAKVLAHKGQFMHGMLQAIMRKEKELKIACMKEKDLSREIKHCQGNKVIKDLEFCFCTFNEKVFEVFKECIPSIGNLSSFTLNIVILEESCRFDSMMECIGKTGIKKLKILATLKEKRQIEDLVKGIKYLRSLEHFKLSLEKDCKMDADSFVSLLQEGCQYLNSECIFDVDIGMSYNFTMKGSNLNDFEQFDGIKAMSDHWPTEWGCPPKNMHEKNLNRDFKEKQHLEKTTGIEGEELIDDSEIGDAKLLNSLKLEDERNQSIEIVESSRGSQKYCFEGFERGALLEALGNKFRVVLENKKENGVIKDDEKQNAIQEGFQRPIRGATEQLELLTTLYLSFEGYIIFDEEFSVICSYGIRHLQSLTALNLIFSNPSNNGLRILSCEGIKYLTLLTSLDLKFKNCYRITDVGLMSLCYEGIKFLPLLTSLHLNFDQSRPFSVFSSLDITDRGLRILGSESIRHLPLLTSLDLKLQNCDRITDEGLMSFCSEGIKHLRFLASLDLRFQNCERITDESLMSLYSEGIRHLPSLTFLRLNFSSCNQIANKSLQILGSEAMRHLPLLTSLDLRFKNCDRITDEGLVSLYSEGIRHLSSLTFLRLNFSNCNQIANKSLQILGSEAMRHLPLLTSLDLKFKNCKQITDDGLMRLYSEGIKHLPLIITSLHLNFDQPKRIYSLSSTSCITDESLQILGSEAIRHLPLLTSLDLRFKNCDRITDKGLMSLCSEGIKNLRFLTSLHLNFGQPEILGPFQNSEITDKSLKILGSERIGHLPRLTFLHLNFASCKKITDEGLMSLCSEGIRHMRLLTSLHLNFDNCNKITDKGLISLGFEGIRYLPLLTSLHLSLFGCDKITQKGFKSLCSEGLKLLPELTSLHLDFANTQVSEKTRSAILSIIQSNIDPPPLSQLEDHLQILKRPINFSSSSFQNLSKSNQNTAFIVYRAEPGFYFKEYPFKCEKSIPQLLKNHSPFDSDSFGIFSGEDLSKQTQKKYHAISFHFNLQSNEIDDYISNQEDIAAKWQDVETLNLIFNQDPWPARQRLKSYWRITQYFKSIRKLNLRFEKITLPLDEILEDFFHEAVKNLKFLKNMSFIFPNTMINEAVKEKIFKTSSVAINLLTLRNFEMKKTDLKIKKQNPQTCISKKKCPVLKTKCQKTEISFQSSLENSDLFLFEELINMNSSQNLNKKIFLSGFQSLLKLSLNLFGISDMTNQGLKNFFIRINCLRTLGVLNLSFSGCRRITDEGLSNLVFQGLRQLSQLTELYLDFGFCTGITDKGVDCLGFEGINHLERLKKLKLNFKWNQYITDRGLENLCSKAIKNLKLLTDLGLSFIDCAEVTDIGLHSLSNDGIQYLESLTSLSLDFCGCENISDQGMKSLSQGITNLESLNFLDLNFVTENSKITDEGFQILCRKGISPLKSLLSLRLNFHILGGISDEGFEYFYCEGLQGLEALTSLELISHGENRITEKGIKSAAFEGISRLVLLENLQISLPQITTFSSSLYEGFVKTLDYFGMKEKEDLELKS